MRLQYKTTTKYLFFSLPFYLMLFACGLQITDVEYALREAGENRGELEAVLSHYAKLDDRQKLEAAQYLIRYMKVCQNSHLLFYAQSPDFHKLGLCYNLKILYL